MDRNRLEELLNAIVDGEMDGQVNGQPAGQIDGDETKLAADSIEIGALRSIVTAMHEAARQQDELLREAFAPRRRTAAAIAERVARDLTIAEPTWRTNTVAIRSDAAGPATRRSAPTPWLHLVLAVAVGFLLAVILLRPWGENSARPIAQAPIDVQPAVAHLAVASGPVQVVSASRLNPYTCPSQGPIESGAEVSTGPRVSCEFSTADGSAVRLNSETAVKFAHPREITMGQGELWSSVARSDRPFAVKSSQTTVTSNEGKFDLSCRTGQTILKVIEGSARASGAHGEQTIAAGQEMKIVDGASPEIGPTSDLLLSTQWLNSVLALKGPGDPELEERLERMFAVIGSSKLQFLYEGEIRALGDASVPPLVHFLKRSDQRVERVQRIEAARILADLAPPKAIPDLIALLADEDGQVRFYIAQALTRLTGQSLGRAPDAWRTDTSAACETTRGSWQNWWETNQPRYAASCPSTPANDPQPAVEPRGSGH